MRLIICSTKPVVRIVEQACCVFALTNAPTHSSSEILEIAAELDMNR